MQVNFTTSKLYFIKGKVYFTKRKVYFTKRSLLPIQANFTLQNANFTLHKMLRLLHEMQNKPVCNTCLRPRAPMLRLVSSRQLLDTSQSATVPFVSLVAVSSIHRDMASVNLQSWSWSQLSSSQYCGPFVTSPTHFIDIGEKVNVSQV